MSARNFIIAIATTVSLATAATHADFYQFNSTLDNGYSVQGVIETRASAPASFIESNPNFPNAPFATQYVDWLNMSVFRFGSTIAEGFSVSSSVSYDPFLRVGFNSSTLNLSSFDAQTRGTDTGPTPYYFISNGVDPSYNPVEYGTTAFNLFLFDPGTSSATYLGSTSALTVTAIPAPATMLAFALLPVARRRQR